ncbi:MAG: pyridoxal-phosphate-dependent aminotransferase family protein [Candidatus Krumholzibacteriia bacterium]
MRQRLFTPGPTPVPDEVALAMAAPQPHHRTPEFQDLMRRTTGLLQQIFRTEDPVVILSSSGTGAMEAAVVNLTRPGERVFSANSGKFGERWGQILRTYGRDLHELDVPWGEPITPEQFHDGVRRSGARAAFVTHSETSTGALCDLPQITDAARDLDVLLVVDAITSLGAHRLETQRWGVDCVVGGSQKAFMMPPGLAFLSLSAKARRCIAGNPTPRYYFDLSRALEGVPKGQSPWTPAISLVMGLERACRMILDEGLEAVWHRHQVLADAVRVGVAALGLQTVASRPSNALTAVYVPEAVGADAVRQTLWERFGMKLAGGQERLAGCIIRLGHLGAFDVADIMLQLSAFEDALRTHGHVVPAGAAVEAARPILAQLDAS